MSSQPESGIERLTQLLKRAEEQAKQANLKIRRITFKTYLHFCYTLLLEGLQIQHNKSLRGDFTVSSASGGKAGNDKRLGSRVACRQGLFVLADNKHVRPIVFVRRENRICLLRKMFNFRFASKPVRILFADV